jgi:hypothetical protein
MATKTVKGHALGKALQQDDNFVWRCECGTVYGAATGDDRISRATARERHRVHLAQITDQIAPEPSRPEER